ncbi:protein lin-9 homolog [Hyalella azteca]|uniref:Protein lin-9 homolog n=1 Tax=Hyalella azteca TaxID=294128 RepID=A0A979FHG0_HYAAZ|nr:protein lin-9 homolog [Hyalella azteca]
MDSDDVSPLQALGLLRVGQLPPRPPPSHVPIPLNKRGMPARVRKKNPMYFDEMLVTSPKTSRGTPRKSFRPDSITPKKAETSSPSHTHAVPFPSSPAHSSPRKEAMDRIHVKAVHSRDARPATMKATRSSSRVSKGKVKAGPSEASSSAVATSHGVQSSDEDLDDEEEDEEPEPLSLTPLKLECSSHRLSSSSASSSSSHISSSSNSNSPPTVSTATAAMSAPYPADRSGAVHDNRLRLRNFLKLPQAHKWIYYEWFYANIDQPLFLGRNDFEQVLREAFPQLSTRCLSRRQWSLIRRIMGKPRRCSQAFFNEELSLLAKRRQVLRLLQQRKISDVTQLRDLPFTLPLHIPCQLVIGTKVTARIRKPENGLYIGHIDAVDTSNNTYRISFTRHGIGTHSIPDYEVLSCDPPEMMPLASFQQKFRPRPPLGLVTPPRPLLPRGVSMDTPNKASSLCGLDSPPGWGAGADAPFMCHDPVLAQSPRTQPAPLTLSDRIGQYPVAQLMHIVRLWKLLESKAEKVKQLEQLNSGAEKLRCLGESVTGAFQRRYATLVLEVDQLNEQLNSELLQVHQFCQEISGGASSAAAPTLLPDQIRERCMAESLAVVQVSNSATQERVTDEESLHLVTALTALMLQVKNLCEGEVSAFELTALQSSINSLRQQVLDADAFTDLVAVPLTHIMAAASQLGPLSGFTSTS